MPLFPSLNPILEEQLNSNVPTQVEPVKQSFLFDFKTKQFQIQDGKVQQIEGIEALKQWISLCIRTVVDSCKIYDKTGFGTSTVNLIGLRMNDFYKSEFKRELKEGLLKNNRIIDGNVKNITQESRKITVDMELTLYDGTTLSINEVI